MKQIRFIKSLSIAENKAQKIGGSVLKIEHKGYLVLSTVFSFQNGVKGQDIYDRYDRHVQYLNKYACKNDFRNYELIKK